MLVCGQFVKWEGRTYMVMGFSGDYLYFKNPFKMKSILKVPSMVHLNAFSSRSADIFQVPYEDVYDLSRFKRIYY